MIVFGTGDVIRVRRYVRCGHATDPAPSVAMDEIVPRVDLTRYYRAAGLVRICVYRGGSNSIGESSELPLRIA
jgi:hypothetical protein